MQQTNGVGLRNESARVAWLERSLSEIPGGWRLLDAGAGQLQFRRLCSHLRYVSQDFVAYEAHGDAHGLHKESWNQTAIDIVSDITAIPEPDQSFDAILCVEVFEHLPDPLAALREFARLLRPKGRLILTAPFASLTHFAPYHFASGFNRYFYDHWLPAYGFQVDEISYNGNYFEYMAQEIRRIPSVAQRYANQSGHPAGVRRLLNRLAQRVLLGWLDQLSTSGDESRELLSFGLHVRATRI